MAKLSLICLRWKLHSKPEKELNWPKTPHKINGISLLPRPAVLKFTHVSESPRGFGKTQSAGPSSRVGSGGRGGA